MSEPKRIQRKRTKGWRMPEGAVYVGRPTRWGNPYLVGGWLTIHADETCAGMTHDLHGSLGTTAAQAVAAYRDLFTLRLALGEYAEDQEPYNDQWRAAMEPLRGRDLACWCPLDSPCHADVLLALANPTLATSPAGGES